MSPFKRAQTAPPVIKYHWLHGIDPNPELIRWFEDDDDDESDYEQQGASEQDSHLLDQLDQVSDSHIARDPDQNTPSDQANMAKENQIKKESKDFIVKKEENDDHEEHVNVEQHDEHEAKKIKRERGGPSSEASWHPSRGPVPSPSIRQRGRSIAPPSSRSQAPTGPSRSRAKSIAPRSRQSQTLAGPSRSRASNRGHVNEGSSIKDAEIALWEQEIITIPEQHRLWDLVSAREPRLRNIKAHILASTEPNLARHVLSQRLIDLRCERWTKEGILNSGAGSSSATAGKTPEKKAIVVDPAAETSHIQEPLRTREAVASSSAMMTAGEQMGESSKQEPVASEAAASTSVDAPTLPVRSELPAVAALPRMHHSEVRLKRAKHETWKAFRARCKAHDERKKITGPMEASNNETQASEGESSTSEPVNVPDRDAILSSESSILPPISALIPSQLPSKNSDLDEIERLKAMKKKKKSEKKRLRELEDLNSRGIFPNVGLSRNAVASKGRSSHPATQPTIEASAKKTKAQRRKERLEQERLDWEKIAAAVGSTSISHALGSQSLSKNDVGTKKDEKRKRAASNASVALPQPILPPKMNSGSNGSSHLPEEGHKNKKTKKKDLAHQSRQDMFDANAEKFNKDFVKKSKEKNGKTVSKKRQKRDAQLAVHGLEVAIKKGPVQSKKRKLQDLPNDATSNHEESSKSKKQKLSHVHDKATAQAQFAPSGFDPSDPDSSDSDSSDDDKPGSDAESESQSDPDDAESSDEEIETPAKVAEFLAKQEALYKTITRSCGPGRIDSSPDTAQITPSKKAVPRPIAINPVPVPPTFGSQKQRTAPLAIAPIEPRKTEVTLANPQINTSAEVVNAITELQKSVRHLSNAFGTALSPKGMDWTPTATNFTPPVTRETPSEHVKKATKTTKEGKGRSKAIQSGAEVQDDSIVVAASQEEALSDNWESTRGKLKANISDRLGNDIKETIAYSGAHIGKKATIAMGDASFWALALAADETAVLEPNSKKATPKLRMCVVIEGKVTVLLHHSNGEVALFQITKGGVWRVKADETCEVHAIDKGKGEQKEGAPIVLIHVMSMK